MIKFDHKSFAFLEVITGVEPAMTVLQTVALPLGYITIINTIVVFH